MDDPARLLARLAREFTERLRRGESPDVEEYARQHPELAERIRELLGTLRLMEEPPSGGPESTPVDGAAATLAMAGTASGTSETPLKSFGDYELLERIATGGMGVVYRARQKSLDRIVALKMIKAGQFATEEEVLRFHTEAEAAGNLQHPNIVAVHEVGELEGQHYFSMDYVQGRSLAEIAAQGDVTPDRAAEYVETVALAVEYAHQHGVLHRDLKPSNVLVDLAGQPKVTDFGLAKRLDSGSDLTTTGSALGSPPYMSPEQAAGQTDQVGRASDVYALGGLLYELLTRRPPFRAETRMETLYLVMETEPTAPRLIDREIPLDLETITLKCLAKSPGDRYESAQEVADELGRFLRGEPILARPLGASGAAPRLTWYISAAILLAIAFAFIAPYLASRLGLREQVLGALLSTIELGGIVFLRLLMMIVVPLVMASVMSGVLGMGDVRKLGRPGGYTLVYFLATTLLAALLGLVVVNLVQPGAGVSADRLTTATLPEHVDLGSPSSVTGSLRDFVVRTLFTDNLFAAMAEGNLLPVIVFSIIFAGMLTTMGRRAETISRLITSANHALLNFVMLLMKVAPIGIFCLVAAKFGQEVATGTFGETFRSLLLYIVVVLAALLVHALVALPLILFLATRRNPYRFLAEMSEALLTAFSTASSSATLPVSIECAEKRARVSRRAVEFVLPLGATVNMNGTALYQACAAVFIAQVVGRSLGPWEQATILITASLAAVAAAGIPHAGMVTMLIVFNTLKLPPEGIALLFTVDWLLDRFRTPVNVFGDAVTAAAVEKSFRR
ncbi:MAG: cation:dicarboxylase symporter family transporter [Planctomycetota bacterium]